MTYMHVRLEPRFYRGSPRLPIIAVIGIAIFMGGIMGIGNHRTAVAERERIACDAYIEAGLNPQSIYDSDPVKYKRLDRDKDGKVCE